MRYADIFKKEEDCNITYLIGNLYYIIKHENKENYCEMSMPLNLEVHKKELKTFLKLYDIIKDITLDILFNHTNFNPFDKNIGLNSINKMSEDGYNKIKKAFDNKFKNFDKYLYFTEGKNKYVTFSLFSLYSVYFNLDNIKSLSDYYRRMNFENFIFNPLKYIIDDDDMQMYLMDTFNDKEYIRRLLENKELIKDILFEIFNNDYFGILDFNDVELLYNGNSDYFFEFSELYEDMHICFTKIPEDIDEKEMEKLFRDAIKSRYPLKSVDVSLL